MGIQLDGVNGTIKTGSSNVHNTGYNGQDGVFTGDLTVTGNIGVAGTLTYEDVTNVDSVGVITARNGIRIGAGKSIGSDGAAVVYYGDGSNLTGAGPTLANGSNDRLVTATGANALNGEANLTYNGNTFSQAISNAGNGMDVFGAGDHWTGYVGSSNRSAANVWVSKFAGQWNRNDIASIACMTGADTTNKDEGQLAFYTTPSGGSETERLRIGSAGQIGLAGANYGSSGQVLTSGGASGAVSWATASGGVSSDAENNTVAGTDAGNAGTWSGANNNTCMGKDAGTSITDGDSNNFIGKDAGKAMQSGSQNTALGTDALTSNTTGNYNIAIGFETLKTSSTGGGNIAIGHKAMNGGDITGANNIAIGYEAGKSFPGNTNGNVAIGYRALYQQNGDRYNTAVGYEAGMNIQAAHDIVAVGHKALKNLTSGAYNTAIGWQALESLETGTRNTAVGRGALDNCVSGSGNVAMGIDAGMNNTSSDNVFVGRDAGRTNTTGNNNVYIGAYVADAGVNGTRNVAVGTYAFSTAAGNGDKGTDNTCLGYGAGHNARGNGNTFVGQQAGNGSTTGSNNCCIGKEAAYGQISTESNQLYIARGNVAAGSNSCWVFGDGNGNVIRAGNGTSWSQTSDRRIKKNIVDNTVGLDVINKIRIRNFEYRTEDEIDRTNFGGSVDDPKWTAEEASEHDGANEGDYCKKYGISKTGVQLGVIAQELEEVLPNMVTTNSTTSKKTTNTDELIWHLVNAVKELSSENIAMKARLDTLESS